MILDGFKPRDLVEDSMDDYLKKQNAALLKTLTTVADKRNDMLLKVVIEQQKQILNLSDKIGTLLERDRVREQQMGSMYRKLVALESK